MIQRATYALQLRNVEEESLGLSTREIYAVGQLGFLDEHSSDTRVVTQGRFASSTESELTVLYRNPIVDLSPIANKNSGRTLNVFLSVGAERYESGGPWAAVRIDLLDRLEGTSISGGFRSLSYLACWLLSGFII